MVTLQMIARKLQSPISFIRQYGCEELSAVHESNPEVIDALERAALDDCEQVAHAARYALRQDVHMQMAKKLGRSNRWMLKAKRLYNRS